MRPAVAAKNKYEALAAVLRKCKSAADDQQHSVDADVQFHLLIAQATGNSYFVELFSQPGAPSFHVHVSTPR